MKIIAITIYRRATFSTFYNIFFLQKSIGKNGSGKSQLKVVKDSPSFLLIKYFSYLCICEWAMRRWSIGAPALLRPIESDAKLVRLQCTTCLIVLIYLKFNLIKCRIGVIRKSK